LISGALIAFKLGFDLRYPRSWAGDQESGKIENVELIWIFNVDHDFTFNHLFNWAFYTNLH
jgi:hypothetical protein